MTLLGRTALSVEIMTKLSTPTASARIRHELGAEHVVLDRLAEVALHHWNVFVGGGVKHHVRPVALHQRSHARFVGDVGHAGDELDVRLELDQTSLDLEQAVLAPLHEHHLLRLERHELTAQLRADAAAGAGHHHPSAANEPREAFFIEDDRLASEEIFDGDGANVRQLDVSGDDLGDAGDDLGGDPRFVAALHDVPDLFAPRAGDGDQGLARVALGAELGQPRGRSQDADAVNVRSHLHRVVVEKPYRLDPQVGSGENFLRHRHAGATGTDEHRRYALDGFVASLLRLAPLDLDAPQNARPRNTEQDQTGVDDDDADGEQRIARVAELADDDASEESDPEENRRARQHGLDDLTKLPQRNVAPDLPGNAEQVEHGVLEQHHVRCEERGPLDHLGRDLPLEAQEEGKPERRGQHEHVDG